MAKSLISAFLAWLIPFSGIMLNELNGLPQGASIKEVGSVAVVSAIFFGILAAAKDWRALSSPPPKKRNEL